jgi:hypothetical protein
VEISRVLVPELDVFYLSALAPIGCFFMYSLAETILSKAAKASLQGGKHPEFLKAIKKRNDRATVHKIYGGKETLASPDTSGRAHALELKAKLTDSGKAGMARADA